MDDRSADPSLQERPVRVLHLTAAMGGGITTALEQYASSTPSIEHFLVSHQRGAFDTGDNLSSFRRTWRTGGGLLRLWVTARRVAREVDPDVVHVHSAVAGWLFRAIPCARRVPIVFSPHSYFFERTTLSKPLGWAARLVERVLASRAMVVALTPHEAALAEGCGSRTVIVPNTVRVEPSVVCTGESRDGVIGVGRLCSQKDTDFFVEVKRAVDRRRPGLPWSWYGSGDVRRAERLEDAGVMVHGWCDRDQVLKAMQHCAVYVHTAAWEGSPMTLLEAQAVGAPTAVRSIPALVSLGYPADVATPEDLAEEVLHLLDGGRPRHKPTSTVDTAGQGDALLEAYRIAQSVQRSAS